MSIIDKYTFRVFNNIDELNSMLQRHLVMFLLSETETTGTIDTF